MKKERITTELKWAALKNEYHIGKVKIGKKVHDVNELKDAIENGEMLAKLQACADELHDGDLIVAVKAYRRTLQSQGSNMRNNKIAYMPTDMIRYELLDAYTDTLVPSKTTVASIGDKARHNYSVEDIKSLAGNVVELQNMYNSFSTYRSRYLAKIEDINEFDARFDLIKELKAEAKRAIPAANAAYIKRLQDGMGRDLNDDEIAELVELLARR